MRREEGGCRSEWHSVLASGGWWELVGCACCGECRAQAAWGGAALWGVWVSGVRSVV